MDVTILKYDKYIVCATPHTTNLDSFIGKLFYGVMGGKTNFMMKKERLFFPLGLLFRAIGGTPIDRSHKTSLVEQVVHHFNISKKFHLAITPGETCKRNPSWKKGFYYIALEAQVPIVLVGIDYTTRTVTSTKAVIPSGDIDRDMREIKLYFKDFKGRHPENFSIGGVE